MNKLHSVLGLSLLCAVSQAGLITHTDYTAGNVITAAGQNTNENTIVTEFNGNISAANLAANAVTTAKITDANVTLGKLDTTLQSTFTYVNTFGIYRRPVLTFQSTSIIDIENNTGTANQTCLQFPDSQRCVTENTASSSINRRFIISETASNTGTKNSGLRTTYVQTVNTWYALYGWKVADNSTDFVIVGDTVVPIQSNYTALNTFYGLNQWVYLGMIRNGDASGGNTSGILAFKMSGNYTQFNNTTSAANEFNSSGILEATSAGATNLTWAGAYGTGSTQIPLNLVLGGIGVASGSGTFDVRDAGNFWYYGNWSTGGTIFYRFMSTVADGIKINNGSSVKMDIFWQSFIDQVLGPGYNAQL